MNVEKTSLRIRGIKNLHEISIIGGDLVVKRAGEPIPPETDHLRVGTWPTSVASVECPLGQGAKCETYLAWACEILEKNRSTFETLTAAGAEIDVYCALGLGQAINLFSIPGPLMLRLGEFKASVSFRIIYEPLLYE